MESNDKGKVIDLFKQSQKAEPKELEPEVSEFIEFATQAGFKELEEVLKIFSDVAEKLDSLILGELFEASMEEVRTAYDKIYAILEDDVDPEGMHGKEKEKYIISQKIRSHFLVKLYTKYKEEK